jgi:hypothetical protein
MTCEIHVLFKTATIVSAIGCSFQVAEKASNLPSSFTLLNSHIGLRFSAAC